jgi:uncharacterized protein (DUF2236 family)
MSRFRLVPVLPPGRAGDPGLIGPASIVWRVARERAVLLGGPTALLLQVAHPLLAAGVAQHSGFEEDPLGRLTGTLNALLVAAFGDRAQALAIAREVAKAHGPVKGILPQTEGEWEKGTAYRASQPDLDLWVYATLIESALDTYSAFVRKLSFRERAKYYDDSEPFGKLFGVTRPVRPPTYSDFQLYYQDMIDNRLVVGPTALQISAGIFQAKLWGVPVNPLAQVLAANLLPPTLAQAYRIQPRPISRASFRLLRGLVWGGIRITPCPLRFWPHYSIALRRVYGPSLESHAP